MKDGKRIKICFIDFYAYPLFHPESKIIFGGSQVQLFLLAKEFAEDPQFEISFVTDDQKENGVEKYNSMNVYKFFRSRPFSRKIREMILASAVRVISILPGFRYLPILTFFYKLLRVINADIYIQRAAGAETGIVGLISKVLNKKFIYMVAHEDDVTGKFIRKNGYRGRLFRLGLKLASKIICQSEEQMRCFEEDLREKAMRIRSAYPIQEIDSLHKEGVLWVGRSEKWKRPELFLRLAERFPDERFTMIAPPADSNPGLFKEIKEEVAKIKNLDFIERVPFEKIDDYFKKAKIFVNTSDYEGFPNTFVQAAKNRTPILSLNVNPDNFITRYNLGLFAQGDFNKLIEALKQILDDEESFKTYSNNAFEYALRDHDIKKITTQYRDLFRELLLKGIYVPP